MGFLGQPRTGLPCMHFTEGAAGQPQHPSQWSATLWMFFFLFTTIPIITRPQVSPRLKHVSKPGMWRNKNEIKSQPKCNEANAGTYNNELRYPMINNSLLLDCTGGSIKDWFGDFAVTCIHVEQTRIDSFTAKCVRTLPRCRRGALGKRRANLHVIITEYVGSVFKRMAAWPYMQFLSLTTACRCC